MRRAFCGAGEGNDLGKVRDVLRPLNRGGFPRPRHGRGALYAEAPSGPCYSSLMVAHLFGVVKLARAVRRAASHFPVGSRPTVLCGRFLWLVEA